MVRPLRIAVTDPIIAGFAERLRRTERAHEWTFVDAGSVRDAIDGADVIVCSRLRADDVPEGSAVRLVHASGAGVDRIGQGAVPPDAAVCNTGHHGVAIAEHVLMVAMMLRRRAIDADRRMRAGEWRTVATAPDAPFHRMLAGSTIGIIGFGEIGQDIARLARGVGMHVIATRRRPEAELPADVDADLVLGQDRLADLLRDSDIVVTTVPLDDRTRGLIDADALAVMRADALLINVARGPIIDEDALFAALSAGRIGGAGIDVWWGAPDGTAAPPSVARFAELENTVLTPHFSGHAREVFERRADDIARNIDLLDRGLPLERRVS